MMRGLAVWLVFLPLGAFANSLADAERAIRERAFERAAGIYRSLSEEGNPEAQYQLASLYRSGRGVEADPAEAVRWLSRSAEAGNPDAQYALATMLAGGRGTTSDIAAANRWFRAAARQGHVGARRKLRKGDALPSPATDDGQGLVQAAERGDTSLVMRSVERYPDRAGAALLAAASRGRIETVRALLSHGADPDHRGSHREAALHWAARRGDLDLLAELLSAGALRNLADDRGTTALHAAARAGNGAAVGRLLAANASIALRDTEGRTALDLAERGGHTAIAERLRRAGARTRNTAAAPDRRRVALWAREGQSSTLTIHARRGDRAAVVALIKTGVSTGDRADAFREAVIHGQLEIVRLLVDATLLARADAAGRLPLELAARSGHASVVRLLLAHGAETEGGAALLAAVAGSHDAVVDVLLGSAREGQDGTLHQALRGASTSGDLPIAEALLAAGADPNDRAPNGATAICAAAALPRASLLGRLIAGRSVSGHNCQGGVPLLHHAAVSPESVRFLLANGGMPNLLGPDGMTPLLIAAGRGIEDSVHLLLEAGADVDHLGPRRRSALMIAAERGHEDVVDLLIEARANPRLRDSAGETASELAARAGYAGIEAKLDAVPAKPWF